MHVHVCVYCISVKNQICINAWHRSIECIVSHTSSECSSAFNIHTNGTRLNYKRNRISRMHASVRVVFIFQLINVLYICTLVTMVVVDLISSVGDIQTPTRLV